MPLDVQPLSPLRRIVMVLVMLALLGSSLGFAQWLILRRENPALQPLPPQVTVRFVPPDGLADMPVNASAEQAQSGLLVEALLEIPRPRHLHAFSFQNTSGATPQEYVETLLDRILADPYRRTLLLRSAVLAEHGAFEAERHIGRGEDSSFAIIRLTTVDGHIVAFCFSGDGVFTDADRQFFDKYCLQQIQIAVEKPSRKG